MHDWLKKNKKKVLAVVGAFLMVSFLISVPVGSLTRGSGTRQPAGRIGKTVLYADERNHYEMQWKLVSSSYRKDVLRAYLQSMSPGANIESFENMLLQSPQFLQMILNQAAQRGIPVMTADQLGRELSTEIHDHPELFLMLVKEAEQRGIRISDDTANSVARNQMSPNPITGKYDPTYIDAARSLLMVLALRDQVMSEVKFTEPQWKKAYAEQFRQVRLNVVEFLVDQYKTKVAPPTTQQVQEQYEKFKNIPPDTHGADDQLGFGYQVPDRVKVQYFKVSHEAAMKAAIESHRTPRDPKDKVPYDLSEKAYIYYDQNQSKYPATQPAATQPATRPVFGPEDISATTHPTTNPSTQAAATEPTTKPTTVAATQPAPTTRPFADVEREIVEDLLKPEADSLTAKVADAIRGRLAEDWTAFNKANPTTMPTTQPTNTAAVPTTQPAFGTYEYLEKIAKDIQSQFGVLPEVTQVPQWLDRKQLEEQPGIGFANIGSRSFAEYALDAAPFSRTSAPGATALKLWQPGEPLSDPSKNSYVFRLTDASPAHAPDLADIRPRLEDDVRIKLAYAAADDAAKQFLATSRQSNFSRAALDEHRNPIVAGPFNPEARTGEVNIPNFHASTDSTSDLVSKSRELLNQATAADPSPVAMVPMPRDRKVIVVQLGDVTTTIPEELASQDRFFEALQYRRRVAENLASDFFSFRSTVGRLDYHPEEKEKSGS